MTSRRSTWLAWTIPFLAAASACGRHHDTAVTPSVAFSALFDAQRSVDLATRADDPLTFAADALVRDDEIVIVDEHGANLKVFSRASGALRRTLGTAGDDRGEFRHPLAVAELDSGRYVVLDQGRRVLSFRDSTGAVIDETPALKGFFNGLIALPNQRRVLLSGMMYGGGKDAKGVDLHEFGYDGRREASYAKTVKPRSNWDSKLAATFVARIGDELITGSLNTNRLRLYDHATGSTKWIDVASSWYEPLEYPSDKLLQRGVTNQTVSERVTAFIHAHRLMNGVLPLTGGAFLVRFMAFTSPSEKAFYYAVADTTGRTYAISRATRANVIATRGDTAFWVTDGAHGTERLHSGILTTSHVERLVAADGVSRTVATR